VLIYVVNVLLENNIWTKKITKINEIIPLKFFNTGKVYASDGVNNFRGVHA